jgi:hypothetical protein
LIALAISEIGNRQSEIGNQNLLSIPERYLHQRQRIGISLLLSLKLEQIVVGAPRRIGKLTTDCWPCMIYRALPRLWIQKVAGLTEDWICLAPKDALLLIHLCEAHHSNFFCHVEMLRKSLDVATCYLNSFINRTTVGRTV